MSKDLIFGFTKKDWSRPAPTVVHECGPEMCMISYKEAPLTDDEKSKLDKLAQVKMKAESGDKQARRQWKEITARVASLKIKARKGDPKAKRTLEVLGDSGLFGPVQKISGLAPQSSRRDDKLTYALGRLDHDEIAAARDGGACELSALSRVHGSSGGIVISDREIKDAMRGSVSLVEGQGSYPRQRRHRHHRRHWKGSQTPGASNASSPGSTYVPSRDTQKSQIVKQLYSRIKREHILWMINQDHQNNIWNQTPDKYQQAGRAWARSQIQQQQLPTRLTPTGTNPWAQPVSWFQSQAQAVLDATTDQRDTAINTAFQNPANAGQPAYAPAPAYTQSPTSTADAYYPAPGAPAPGTASPDDPSLYDDDQQGWPSPLLMHGDSFVGDEARAEGEDSSSCGNSLPHGEYRALVMNQAIKRAGGRRPSTKHLFTAKSAVDQALGSSGVSIYIPGAGQRRRTV